MTESHRTQVRSDELNQILKMAKKAVQILSFDQIIRAFK